MPYKDPIKKAEHQRAYREANKEKEKAYREANKEKLNANKKSYYEANKEKEKARKKAYYEANKEKIKANGKAYNEANKEHRKAYREANKEKEKAYREANKEKRKAYGKAYREANKEKLNANKKAYRETNKKKIKAKKKVYRETNKEKTMWTGARSRAKKKKLPFNLSLEDIVVPDVCPVLGLCLETQKEQPSDCSPSLDRMVPDLGYIKGNVKVISKRANTLKSNATIEELEKVLKYLREIEGQQ